MTDPQNKSFQEVLKALEDLAPGAFAKFRQAAAEQGLPWEFLLLILLKNRRREATGPEEKT